MHEHETEIAFLFILRFSMYTIGLPVCSYPLLLVRLFMCNPSDTYSKWIFFSVPCELRLRWKFENSYWKVGKKGIEQNVRDHRCSIPLIFDSNIDSATLFYLLRVHGHECSTFRDRVHKSLNYVSRDWSVQECSRARFTNNRYQTRYAILLWSR